MTPAPTPAEIALARLEAVAFRIRINADRTRAKAYRAAADHLKANRINAAIGMAREA
ncbi:MAG: hypothetical protein AAGA72_18625 [Pseudomonadota bacterium]